MKRGIPFSQITWGPLSPLVVRRLRFIGLAICVAVIAIVTFLGLHWALTGTIVLEAKSGPLVITTLSSQRVIEVGTPPEGALLTIRSSKPFEVGIYNMLVSNEQFDEELEVYTTTVGLQGTPTLSLLSSDEVSLIIRTYEQGGELPVTTRLLYSPEVVEGVRAALVFCILILTVLVGVIVGMIFYYPY